MGVYLRYIVGVPIGPRRDQESFSRRNASGIGIQSETHGARGGREGNVHSR